MYPYPYPPGYYQAPPYPPPSYVPCVFCRSTIPSNAMANHLVQCPSARASLPPTAMSTPFGTTQSVQYRRVVRVEKKSAHEDNIRRYPVYQPDYRTPADNNLLSWDNQPFEKCITDQVSEIIQILLNSKRILGMLVLYPQFLCNKIVLRE